MTATERGPGGWPLDPELAFYEAHVKLSEARKEAEHWRSNHAQLLRRFKAAQTFRSDLVEGKALLKRVVDESTPNISGELRRAISNFLERAARTLDTPDERQSP
jgi:hypothetical protein